jgi:DNA-binding MarR family transcriptional regulator/GNAT superfamily N-acetyltransferase
MEPRIAAVRQFNRVVSHRVGALNEDYLTRHRPLGASRVLWEVQPGGTDVRTIRARLDLDPGYLSRLLRRLEDEGLIEAHPYPDDRRVRVIRLTAAGRTERAELDRRSDDLARSLLAPLSDAQRDQLLVAMTTVERLLTAGLVDIRIEQPTTRDAKRCLLAYFNELNTRFGDGFDPTLSISAAADELTPPAGLMLLARLADIPVACGALKLHARRPAELKRMWVDPTARGLGLGRRLLRELEHHARESGAKVVRLETNRELTEAIHLYRSCGYREVAPFNNERYAHHWFEKNLTAP